MGRPLGSRNRYPRPDRKVVVRRLVNYPPPTSLDTPCRLWQSSLNGTGYGRKWVDGHLMLVHRWVWEQANGSIPAGMYVLHRCDQPLCYRYDHLFLGTAADNTRDMEAKNRQAGRFEATDDHPTRKLSLEDYAEIRSRYTGAWGEQSALARKYDVNCTTIIQILGRRGARSKPSGAVSRRAPDAAGAVEAPHPASTPAVTTTGEN